MSPCSRARSIHSEISRRYLPVRCSSSSSSRWWACGERCVSSIAGEATRGMSGLLQRAGPVGHPVGGDGSVGLGGAFHAQLVAGLDVALSAGLRAGVAGRLVAHDLLRRAVGLADVDAVAVDDL